MKNRKEKNLFSYRCKTRWLLLITLLIVPLVSPIGVQPLLASTTMQQQQKRSITGTVVDSSGEPIIGANVVVLNNKSIGSITDIDGNFRLNDVPEGSKLVVSFIGYDTQTVTIKGNNLNITLEEDSQMLGEVEVVAYGTAVKILN